MSSESSQASTSHPTPPRLNITICVTAEHTQASLAQAHRLQANLIQWPVPGRIILVGCSSEILQKIVEEFKRVLPKWTTELHPILAEYKRDESYPDAMMILARLRTFAFSEARKDDPDYVWSLDSDVLPPANALRSMYDMLQFDNGYYAVATCPYANMFMMGGRGERTNPIYPSIYEDERKVPKELLEARKKLLEERPADWQPQVEALNERIKNCPPIGNVFVRNGQRWRPRGWLDDAYPGLGKGAIVPVDWAGFGCNLINREALAHINWDGYQGGGTEDLFVCYERWEQAGLRLCAIMHVLCDHVKVNPGRPEERIIYKTRHEIDGECVGHCRIEHMPYYQFQEEVKRNPKFRGRMLHPVKAKPAGTPVPKLIEEAYNIGMLQVYGEISEFVAWFLPQKIQSVLEIGTNAGGLMYLLLNLGVERWISVDLPNGPYSTGVDTEWRDEVFSKAFPDKISFVSGHSLAPPVANAVKAHLAGAKVDLLIIDGDHTLARKDFETYWKNVRPGGWVFFHDIKDTPEHRAQKVTSMDDWEWVKKEFPRQTFTEIVDPGEPWGGIGLIQMPDRMPE